jgi:hypothetical protein
MKQEMRPGSGGRSPAPGELIITDPNGHRYGIGESVEPLSGHQESREPPLGGALNRTARFAGTCRAAAAARHAERH